MTTTRRPVRRPTDCWPDFILQEYRRLAALPDPVVSIKIENKDSPHFSCGLNAPTSMAPYLRTGSDHTGLQVAVSWLREGPKIADVTEEQYQALSRVEVRLELADFTMPYPTVLVNLPSGKMHDFIIIHKRDIRATDGDVIPLLMAAAISPDNTHDIVTICRQYAGREIEESLGKFESGIEKAEGESTHVSLRVACNLMLAMTNFGFQAQYFFPKEVEQERKYIAKGDRPSREGWTASMRLAEQPMVVTLDRSVKLYHHEGGHAAGEPTGREMPFHWRRGHWRKARVGMGRQQTKLTFVRPCMVRADLLVTNPANTTTTYQKL